MKTTQQQPPALRPPGIRGRKYAAELLVASTVLLLAACNSSDGKGDTAADRSPAATRPAQTASADAKKTAGKEAVAAYKAYWQEMQRLYANPTGKGSQLDQYAASAALKTAQADSKRTHDRGNVIVGHVTITESTVTKADATRRIPNVTLSNCLDVSKWETIDAKTKTLAHLPNSRLLKYRIVSTVEKYPEGWRVTRDQPQGKTC